MPLVSGYKFYAKENVTGIKKFHELEDPASASANADKYTLTAGTSIQYTLTLSEAPVDRQQIAVRFHAANTTTAPQITVTGLTPKPILVKGVAPKIGELNGIFFLFYDATAGTFEAVYSGEVGAAKIRLAIDAGMGTPGFTPVDSTETKLPMGSVLFGDASIVDLAADKITLAADFKGWIGMHGECNDSSLITDWSHKVFVNTVKEYSLFRFDPSLSVVHPVQGMAPVVLSAGDVIEFYEDVVFSGTVYLTDYKFYLIEA